MKKYFTAFDLKVLAVTLMFLDHFAKYLPSYLPENLDLIFRYAARIVAPIFFFLAVESYFHTKNKKKYIIRLYLAAAIMAVGNLIMSLLVTNEFKLSYYVYLGQNIFLTIAIGVSIVACFEWVKKMSGYNKLIPLFVIYLLSIAGLFVESSIFGLVMFYIFYFFRGKKYLFVVYSILPILMLIWQLIFYQNSFWIHDYRWFVLSAIPFLLLYNGKRGRSFKYFFYIFYPIHIWILYYLSYALLLK